MKHKDFSRYVDMAMAGRGLDAMRPVVEKELLHYEIFNALDSEGLLKNLVFQGGTSLRLCRGSDRFSEDLDFAGGKAFTSDSVSKIKACVTQRVGDRFGLDVTVREPRTAKQGQNVQVDKWTVSVETHPGRPDLPRQKIKLEIANIPAYTREVVPLRMNYSVLDGVSPTLVVAESIHEILADKLVALPTSIAKIDEYGIADTAARIRYRDIWDIAWLTGQGAEVDMEMVWKKVADYGIQEFPRLLDHAISQIPEIAASHAFRQQMSRFVERSKHEKIFGMPGYEGYFTQSVNTLLERVLREQKMPTQL
ncbi:nucleotidyl transferase AbiEii/AbiGii toxin family protein [Acidithiobacillus sp. HP-6]|uniref:nucleotidyl transferase AbiEii/AbiGii toxin family protein n=1 Tax=unclassified Acidithiobacillus TaxID=2614800 RepID=UPI001879254C|nr:MULTISPECIES: nucleotidyl transferase AbiEii/AbiGii toxin family protein [unclassified Acidithiobacillus]MBE7564108.1 nucleotidyl transferase AbiEii/AbiGii toxin family protein [Acidithiobacillus sp. HP-6]MBE7570809.1 nucleotidyl transferase AbiEii/AbiGii toxin family protein [Acidithiobacillus sp. HP-2]